MTLATGFPDAASNPVRQRRPNTPPVDGGTPRDRDRARNLQDLINIVHTAAPVTDDALIETFPHPGDAGDDGTFNVTLGAIVDASLPASYDEGDRSLDDLGGFPAGYVTGDGSAVTDWDDFLDGEGRIRVGAVRDWMYDHDLSCTKVYLGPPYPDESAGTDDPYDGLDDDAAAVLEGIGQVAKFFEGMNDYGPDDESFTDADGRPHRDGGPAVVTHTPAGTTEQWYRHGNLHRDGGPAVTETNMGGTVRHEAWFDDGSAHRVDGPADVTYRPDGTPLRETWFEFGRKHREGGPAETFRDESGSVVSEGWFTDGERHRVDGPAKVTYRSDGSVEEECWFDHGDLHRGGGPAWVAYEEDGSVSWSEWYDRGTQVDGG